MKDQHFELFPFIHIQDSVYNSRYNTGQQHGLKRMGQRSVRDITAVLDIPKGSERTHDHGMVPIYYNCSACEKGEVSFHFPQSVTSIRINSHT